MLAKTMEDYYIAIFPIVAIALFVGFYIITRCKPNWFNDGILYRPGLISMVLSVIVGLALLVLWMFCGFMLFELYGQHGLAFALYGIKWIVGVVTIGILLALHIRRRSKVLANQSLTVSP